MANCPILSKDKILGETSNKQNPRIMQTSWQLQQAQLVFSQSKTRCYRTEFLLLCRPSLFYYEYPINLLDLPWLTFCFPTFKILTLQVYTNFQPEGLELLQSNRTELDQYFLNWISKINSKGTPQGKRKCFNLKIEIGGNF